MMKCFSLFRGFTAVHLLLSSFFGFILFIYRNTARYRKCICGVLALILMVYHFNIVPIWANNESGILMGRLRSRLPSPCPGNDVIKGLVMCDSATALDSEHGKKHITPFLMGRRRSRCPSPKGVIKGIVMCVLISSHKSISYYFCRHIGRKKSSL